MRHTLTRKLAWIILGFLLVTGSTALAAINNLQEYVVTTDHLSDYTLPLIEQHGRFSRHLSRALAETQAYLLGNNPKDRAEALAMQETARSDLAALASVRPDVENEVHAHDAHDPLQRQRETLFARSQTTIEQALRTADLDAAVATERSYQAIEELEDELEQLQHEAERFTRYEVLASTTAMRARNQHSLRVIPISYGVYVVVAGLMLLALRHFIVKPILALSRAAHAVTRGDLDQHVEVSNKDEIGDLQQAFNDMVHSLHDQEQARKHHEAELARMAFHDHLTGLPNRALFLDRARHALMIARRRNTRIAILFVDLDHFKVINDSLGHQHGDQLLVLVAERLRLGLRSGDTIARFGGDEFVILLEDITDEHDAITVADHLAQALCAPFALGDRELVVTTSIGVALSTSDTAEPDDLIRDADTAMYRAKLHGRSRYQVFDPSMSARARERLELEADLRRALDRDELQLYYQPIVDLSTGTTVGMEALVRWQHPLRGMIRPDLFLPIAEETGLIHPLSLWVLGRACQQMREWQSRVQALAPHHVSVNISGQPFNDPAFITTITQTLQTSGLKPACLEIEITESTLMEQGPAIMTTLEAVKRLGVRLAIDDFGIGYSSLAYLKRFPIDTLKIDRAFVKGVKRDPEDTAIVDTIVRLAQALDMQVTAEGIETDEQVRYLRALGCQRGQGFYFARPLPGETVAEWLQARSATTLPVTT